VQALPEKEMIHQAHTPGCTHLDPGMYRASWTGSIVRFEYRDTEDYVITDERACENLPCWVIVDHSSVKICDDPEEAKQIALRGLA
jgi:hypothetical protein